MAEELLRLSRIGDANRDAWVDEPLEGQDFVARAHLQEVRATHLLRHGRRHVHLDRVEHCDPLALDPQLEPKAATLRRVTRNASFGRQWQLLA